MANGGITGRNTLKEGFKMKPITTLDGLVDLLKRDIYSVDIYCGNTKPYRVMFNKQIVFPGSVGGIDFNVSSTPTYRTIRHIGDDVAERIHLFTTHLLSLSFNGNLIWSVITRSTKRKDCFIGDRCTYFNLQKLNVCDVLRDNTYDLLSGKIQVRHHDLPTVNRCPYLR